MFTHLSMGPLVMSEDQVSFQQGQGQSTLKGRLPPKNMSRSLPHPSVLAEARSVFKNRLSPLSMAGRANMNLC